MPTRSELWYAALKEVATLTDKLGLGIDSRIIDIVAALRMHGFSTNQSCEGHLGGRAYPWVQIYSPPPKGWRRDEKKKREWTAMNLKERACLQRLLAEFYNARRAPYDIVLSFSPIGIYGGFRLQNIGSPLVKTLSSEEQVEKLHSYQDEMAAFTEFLKARITSN